MKTKQKHSRPALRYHFPDGSTWDIDLIDRVQSLERENRELRKFMHLAMKKDNARREKNQANAKGHGRKSKLFISPDAILLRFSGLFMDYLNAKRPRAWEAARAALVRELIAEHGSLSGGIDDSTVRDWVRKTIGPVRNKS